METQGQTKPNENREQTPAEHVAAAHRLLQALREKVGEHPELGEAITRLEMALNILAVQTGGML